MTCVWHRAMQSVGKPAPSLPHDLDLYLKRKLSGGERITDPSLAATETPETDPKDSNDTNNSNDVFVHDPVTRQTWRAAVSTEGKEGSAEACGL